MPLESQDVLQPRFPRPEPTISGHIQTLTQETMKQMGLSDVYARLQGADPILSQTEPQTSGFNGGILKIKTPKEMAQTAQKEIDGNLNTGGTTEPDNGPCMMRGKCGVPDGTPKPPGASEPETPKKEETVEAPKIPTPAPLAPKSTSSAPKPENSETLTQTVSVANLSGLKKFHTTLSNLDNSKKDIFTTLKKSNVQFPTTIVIKKDLKGNMVSSSGGQPASSYIELITGWVGEAQAKNIINEVTQLYKGNNWSDNEIFQFDINPGNILPEAGWRRELYVSDGRDNKQNGDFGNAAFQKLKAGEAIPAQAWFYRCTYLPDLNNTYKYLFITSILNIPTK